MIVTKNYSEEKKYSFDVLIFNTTEKSITIKYNESGQRIVSFVEIYSAIKELYINDQQLLSYPFPIEFITESSLKLINGYSLKIN